MISPITKLVEQAKQNITTISALEAKAFSQQHECLIIDVRETGEVQTSAINNSISIPRGVLEIHVTSKCNDVNMPILVHCQSGGRACLATEQLVKMGYKNVKAITASHQEMCEHFNL